MSLLRFRARRAPFRRAGVHFSSINEWVEPADGELTSDQVTALVAEPNLEVETRARVTSKWTPLPDAERQAAQAQIVQAFADERVKATVSERYRILGADDALKMAQAMELWGRQNPDQAAEIRTKLAAEANDSSATASALTGGDGPTEGAG